jgi:dsRNA-specific ribonuclease
MGSNDRLEKVRSLLAQCSLLNHSNIVFPPSTVKCQVCRHLQLNRFVMTAPLARGQWLPTCIDFTEGTELKAEDPLGSKIYADIVESILGLVYLEFGYVVSLKVADELNVTLPWDDNCVENSNDHDKNLQLLNAVRRCTGYHGFKQPELVDEAFTHPSANHPSVPSYQRLEWVGDAVLCLAVREWIFKKFPEISLGEMVVFEAALVSNETLAFLSIKNGLQHNLNHRDHSLPSRIESYSWSVRELGSGLWGAGKLYTCGEILYSFIGIAYSVSCFNRSTESHF